MKKETEEEDDEADQILKLKHEKKDLADRKVELVTKEFAYAVIEELKNEEGERYDLY